MPRITQITRLVLDYLKSHRDELPTPLYLYSEHGLNESAMTYRELFPKSARIFYSLKANPQPGVVQYFSSLGIGAEITGLLELDTIVSVGLAESGLLAGGVSKSESFLSTLCHKKPASIVIESEAEWQRLKNVALASDCVSILLRINPGRTFGGMNMAGGTQFGLSLDQALSIGKAASDLAYINFLGLHFYFGSQRLAVSPIINAIDVVEETMEVFQQAGLELKVIDLGLGCGVPYLAKDSDLDIPELREQLWQRWHSVRWSSVEIWKEAGRSLVAGAGYFVTRVMERKHLHGKTFVFLDG